MSYPEGTAAPRWWTLYRQWWRLVRNPYVVAATIGVAAVAALWAAELSRALAGPVGPDGRGYGASAVGQPAFPPLDTVRLAAATEAWSRAAADGAPTHWWFLGHAVADLVLAGALIVLLGAWLERLAPGSPVPGTTPAWRTSASSRAGLVTIPAVLVGLLDAAGTITALAVLAPWRWPTSQGRLAADPAAAEPTAAELAVGPLWLVTGAAFLTWLAVVVTVALAVRLWLREREAGDDPGWGAAGALDWLLAAGRERDRRGRRRPFPVPGVLGGLVVTVLAFGLLVALPVEGPGQQIPDVVRGQLAGDRGVAGAALSIAPLLALAATTYAAGVLATLGGPGVQPRTWTRRRDRVVGTALLVTGLAALGVTLPRLLGEPEPATLPTLAPALTVSSVVLLGSLAAAVSRAVDRPEPQDHAEAQDHAGPQDHAEPQDRAAPALPTGPAQQAQLAQPTGPDQPRRQQGQHPAWLSAPAVESWHVSRRAWLAALSSLVLVVGAVGMLRALVPVFVYAAESGAAVLWYAGLALGASLVVVGLVPVAVRLAVRSRPRPAWERPVAVAAAAAATPTAAAAVWLVARPGDAWVVGSNGALAVAVGAFALVAGGAAWLGRRAALPATGQLGLGLRTPWLALLVVAWLVAGLLDADGGYHDARTLRTGGEPTPQREVATAFTEWASTADACGEPDSVPLLLVAAPGGGIKAAYWSALGLDALTRACPTALFAVSGVSGGAVGSTVALARGPEVDAAPAVREMSEDRALATLVAATLLRDTPGALLGVRTGWADRAALFEDELVDASDGALGTRGDPLPFDELGAPWRRGTATEDRAGAAAAAGAASASASTSATASATGETGFAPLVVLAGASVWDGCRVLLTTAASLPATAPAESCAEAPAAGVTPPGPVTRSVDGTAGLMDPLAGTGGTWSARWSASGQPGAGDPCPAEAVPGSGGDAEPRLRAVTAASLSARFPYITPSGALRRCVGEGEAAATEVTYVVDGGYLENQGMLTLLQLWRDVEPFVRECNARAAAGRPAGGSGADDGLACPHSPDRGSGSPGEPLAIDPWVVELDPNYRSPGVPVPASQPREILAPVLTALQGGTVVDVPALRQGAAAELRPDPTAPVASSPGFSTFSPGPPAGITPPLGWVLSPQSRQTLETQRDCAAAAQPEALTATLDLDTAGLDLSGCAASARPAPRP